MSTKAKTETARSIRAPRPAGIALPAAPAPPRTVLRVRATRTGYYGERRLREGDVFTLEKVEHYTDTWMEPVDPRTREKVTSAPQALKRHHDELIKERFTPAGSETVHDEEGATGDLNPLLS